MLDPMASEANRPSSYLAGLPPEIRYQIYKYLLVSPKPLRIEVAQIPHHLRPFTPPSTPTQVNHSSTSNPTIKPHNLSSQVLRVSRLLHAEALALLYTHNTYDVSARSSLHALTLTIPPPLFHLITTLTLDWDSLQDFSFQLAKVHFLALLSSLNTLNLATWRTRVLSSQSAFLWRDVQSYERTICSAALLILQRHPKLTFVAQRRWVRQLGGRSRDVVRRNLLRHQQQHHHHQTAQEAEGYEHAIPPSQNLAFTSISNPQNLSPNSPYVTSTTATSTSTNSSPAFTSTAATVNQLLKRSVEEHATTRIKWRFLASSHQLDADEESLDLDSEVAALMAQCRPENEGATQMALDPI